MLEISNTELFSLRNNVSKNFVLKTLSLRPSNLLLIGLVTLGAEGRIPPTLTLLNQTAV